MGSDKANIEIDGKTMLDRVAAALGQVCWQVVVLGESRAGYENWTDDIDSPGPLAGIATALNRARQNRVLVVAVDNAFVRAETLAQLVAVESELPVVPVDAAGVRQVVDEPQILLVTCRVSVAALTPVLLRNPSSGPQTTRGGGRYDDHLLRHG